MDHSPRQRDQAQRKSKIGMPIDLAQMELDALIKGNLTPEKRTQENITALVSFYQDSDAQCSIQTMLLSQMLSVHTQTMKLMAKANEVNSITASEVMLAMANKFMRTFTTQVEAFEKFKRGGHQSIKVDHVHVHEGGQAIVGNVQHPRK